VGDVDVEVRGQNIEVTAALESYLASKLHKLDRYPGIGAAQARMAIDGEAHVVEVTVPVDDRILRAEAASDDMYASIDQVSDRLLHQLKKYRERTVMHAHAERPPRNGSGERVTQAPGVEGLPSEIVRVKEFPAKPMTVEEAVLRLDLVGHDFYAFRDAERDEVCVLYRRRGGGYGLLVPQS
jgi:putative sigma-54 modulation protein